MADIIILLLIVSAFYGVCYLCWSLWRTPEKEVSSFSKINDDRLVVVKMPRLVRTYIRFCYGFTLIFFLILLLYVVATAFANQHVDVDTMFAMLIGLTLYGLQTWALYWASGYGKNN